MIRIMKDIAHFMQFLGVADGEIKTYQAALKKGSSTVVDIAKETGLSRQAVYDAIGTMTERGLMSSVQVGKKRLFTAEPPSKLLAYAKRRDDAMKEQISDLERSLPALELQIGGARPLVRLYEGKEAIHAYLADVQKNKPKKIFEIADTDAMYELLSSKDLEPVRNELKRARTEVEGMYFEKSPRPRAKKGYSLPHGAQPFRANITLYDDKVAFVSFSGKVFSVIIENPNIAGALRNMFELAMKQAATLDRS